MLGFINLRACVIKRSRTCGEKIEFEDKPSELEATPEGKNILREYFCEGQMVNNISINMTPLTKEEMERVGDIIHKNLLRAGTKGGLIR